MSPRVVARRGRKSKGKTDKEDWGIFAIACRKINHYYFLGKGKKVGSYLRRALLSEVAEKVLRRYSRHIAGLVVV